MSELTNKVSFLFAQSARTQVSDQLEIGSLTPKAVGKESEQSLTNAVMIIQMNYRDRITIDPGKCGGRPCIRGMRIRVKDVLNLLAEKVPREEILEDFPYLEDEDIDASIQYAAAQMDHPILSAVTTAT